MIEKFRAVESLEHGDINAYTGNHIVFISDQVDQIEMDLRWLEAALPCTHKSGACAPEFRCRDCGETLP